MERGISDPSIDVLSGSAQDAESGDPPCTPGSALPGSATWEKKGKKAGAGGNPTFLLPAFNFATD